MLVCKIIEYEIEKILNFLIQNMYYEDYRLCIKNEFNSFVDEISMYNTF